LRGKQQLGRQTVQVRPAPGILRSNPSWQGRVRDAMGFCGQRPALLTSPRRLTGTAGVDAAVMAWARAGESCQKLSTAVAVEPRAAQIHLAPDIETQAGLTPPEGGNLTSCAHGKSSTTDIIRPTWPGALSPMEHPYDRDGDRCGGSNVILSQAGNGD